MRTVLEPGARYGEVTIPASKSQAHRLLICAALGRKPSVIFCDTISKDIQATINCLNAAGACITVKEAGRIVVEPIQAVANEDNIGNESTRVTHIEKNSEPEATRATVKEENSEPETILATAEEENSEPEAIRATVKEENSEPEAQLFCGESASTLRFLIPVMGAIGRKCVFHMEGRLPERPISVFTDELMRHGMRIRKEGNLLRCEGKLNSGTYTIPGNISSQFISGLLMALPLLNGDSVINITESIESGDYLTMTEDVMRLVGIEYTKIPMSYYIKGNQSYVFPREVRTEADWSGAAYWICIGTLSERGVLLRGLSIDSSQGDKKIMDIVRNFGAIVEVRGQDMFVKKGKLKGCVIDAADVPDLVPTISALASVSEGETRILHAGRLRYKETDRLETTASVMSSLGADITETDDGLIIKGKKDLGGGVVNPRRDHRIAMMAAVAACACTGQVEIVDSECVNKSYPGFFDDFGKLRRLTI